MRAGGAVPDEIVRVVAFRPRNLVEDPALALQQFLTAPWFHRNGVHIAYITAFFLLIAVPFEAHEGTRRTLAVFVLASAASALLAGCVLLVLQQTVDAAWVRASVAWGWAGGSAGTFGLFGASLHRSRRPLVLLACILAYETFNELVYLQNFTPVFHVSALAAGWAVAAVPMRRGAGARLAPP